MNYVAFLLWWLEVHFRVWWRRAWRFWAKALGEKAGVDDREADYIAWIRTIIVLTALITNVFIMSGVIRHWNR